jgi:hypothetical protein
MQLSTEPAMRGRVMSPSKLNRKLRRRPFAYGRGGRRLDQRYRRQQLQGAEHCCAESFHHALPHWAVVEMAAS